MNLSIGSCCSPEFGVWTWGEFESSIWFTEQDGRSVRTVLVFDLLTCEGVGHAVNDGMYGPPTNAERD